MLKLPLPTRREAAAFVAVPAEVVLNLPVFLFVVSGRRTGGLLAVSALTVAARRRSAPDGLSLPK